MPDWRSYDGVAEEYERVWAPLVAKPGRDLVALAGPGPDASALDLGTGTGVVAQALADSIGDRGVVIGVDISPEMLRVGRRRRPGLHLAAAEAIDLPFRDATFDLVTGNFVISHFTRYRTALYDILRVLKRGGCVAVSAWGPVVDEFTKSWQEVVEGVVGRQLLEDVRKRVTPWQEHFSERKNLESALYDAGVRQIHIETREYRHQFSRDDYLAAREASASGRFTRDMLGPARWETFREQARRVFAERFPDPLTDFNDVLFAVGTKP
jgi:ubiquinone/menaquinone biosynthesis C-methylase UbiE